MAKANYIETKKAIDDITSAIDSQIVKAESLNTAVGNLANNYAKIPSQYLKTQKDLADTAIVLAQNEAKLQKAITDKISAQNKEVISNNNVTKSTLQTEAAIERKNKALERENAKLAQANNLYNQTQAKVNQLTQVYNNLAIKKELGEKLTANEIIQLHKLTSELNIYQSALKKVDADIQKNQRNVGNYASGWNGLGNSINQLTREAPAFANSVQTGFMALSNNIPILFDEITKIKNVNAELLAQGKPVKSLFSQIAGSIFSWGTALSVGVTLLTIFGPKIWDMVSGSKATKKALEEEKKVREEKAQIEKQAYESQVKYASDEQAKAKILLETAKNLTLSFKDREKAVTELQKRYPDYLGNLSKEQILAGDTADAEFRLNDALMKRAMFLAVQDKIIEVTKQLVDTEMQYVKTNKEAINTQDLYDASIQNQTKSKQKLRLVNEQDLATTKGLEAVVKSGNKTVVNSTTVYNEKTLAIRKQLDVLYSLLNGYAKYANVVDDSNKKDKKAKREDIEAIKLQVKANEGLLQKLYIVRDGFQQLQKQTSNNSKEFKAYTELIKYYQVLIDSIEKDALAESAKKGTDEFIRLNSNLADTTKKLSEVQDAFFKTFQQDFFSNAGMPTLFKYLNGELDEFLKSWEGKFEVITQIAQEAFAQIAELSNQRFQREYEHLQQEKEIALLFAGESASAREEIERQAEAKRQQIARREFQAKKTQALFNIAIDTAQAIVATLARTPLPAGLPFVIATGALGAAQAAIVLSQQAPQFWTGTDNAPQGWAWTQEKGREIITDSKGNIKSTGSDKGAQLTYLNKGDKVFNNDKTMDYLMFSNDLNNILTGNQIGSPVIEVNNSGGITDNQVNKIVNAIESKAEFSQLISNGDLKTVVRKGNNETEILNRRVRFEGKKV